LTTVNRLAYCLIARGMRGERKKIYMTRARIFLIRCNKKTSRLSMLNLHLIDELINLNQEPGIERERKKLYMTGSQNIFYRMQKRKDRRRNFQTLLSFPVISCQSFDGHCPKAKFPIFLLFSKYVG